MDCLIFIEDLSAYNFKWKHKLCKIKKNMDAKVFKNEKVINVERKKKVFIHSKSFLTI